MSEPPFPHDLATQNTVLKRFVKQLIDYSNDRWVSQQAEELIKLFGDPDAPKPPMGVINALPRPTLPKPSEGLKTGKPRKRG